MERESDINSLKARIRELEERLAESEQTLGAIRSGEVDAILISTEAGEQIYTLKGAQDPYRVLFEQLSEGALTISETGEVTYCNQSFAQMMKIELEKVIGTNLINFIKSSDINKLQNLLKRSLSEAVRTELIFEALDGTEVPMLLSGSFLLMDGCPIHCIVVSDLTERIQAEEDLRTAYEQSEMMVQERTSELVETTNSLQAERDRLQLILDSLPVGVSVTDAKGRVLIRNRMIKESLERDLPFSNDISDYGHFIGYHPGTDVPFEAKDWPLANALKTGKNVNGMEIEIPRREGGRSSILSLARLIKGENGEITGGIAAFIDITIQKNAEKALARSNKELQQFAYVASHDLQEPLRMVISHLTLLERKYKKNLDPKAQEHIRHAVAGGERMRLLIDDLLKYSRVETKGIEFALVDMNEVVALILADLQEPIQQSEAEITVDELPTVMADKPQMVQVIQNLVGNALKFHGSVRPIIHISVTEGAGEWTFFIKDNGIGLKMEYSDKIFQMFQRLHTSEEYPGSGVGLAISKKIVERHGGRIWVVSEEGKGATFFFTIPTAESRNGKRTILPVIPGPVSKMPDGSSSRNP